MNIQNMMIGIFTCLAVSWAMTGLVCRYARQFGFVDVPNERSSHARIVPRSGGLAIVVTFFASFAFLLNNGFIPEALVGIFLPGAFFVALVGFVDDRMGVPSKIRLLVHLISASVALWFLQGFPPVPIGTYTLDLGVMGYLIGVLFVIWLLNLYNFMDGIDGIAGVETITASLGAAVIVFLSKEELTGISLLLMVIGGSTAGFLIWNWPPAKIFMGDVASGFLGFVFGVIAIYTAIIGELYIWTWLILLGVFIVDSTYTLFRRMSLRQRWYSAHRSHAYQKASRKIGNHRTITLITGIINIFWLLPLAFAAQNNPTWAVAFWALSWAPLLGLAIFYQAGMPDEEKALF